MRTFTFSVAVCSIAVWLTGACTAETEDPAACGNGACEAHFGEAAETCPADCPPCGDQLCDVERGETIDTCASDCLRCGDHRCDEAAGENTAVCREGSVQYFV